MSLIVWRDAETEKPPDKADYESLDFAESVSVLMLVHHKSGLFAGRHTGVMEGKHQRRKTRGSDADEGWFTVDAYPAHGVVAWAELPALNENGPTTEDVLYVTALLERFDGATRKQQDAIEEAPPARSTTADRLRTLLPEEEEDA